MVLRSKVIHRAKPILNLLFKTKQTEITRSHIDIIATYVVYQNWDCGANKPCSVDPQTLWTKMRLHFTRVINNY